MDKRTQLGIELLEASKAEIAANRDKHKVQTNRIRTALRQRHALKAARVQTPLPKIPLDFLAIGDSWFEYPLDGNGPSFGNTAIVAQTQLGSMGVPPPQILNQALHGQATTAMLSYENQETMRSLLEDKEQWLNQATGLPDAILVSAGGDDLVGDQLAVYVDYGGGGLDAKRFQGVSTLFRRLTWIYLRSATSSPKACQSLVTATTMQSRTMFTLFAYRQHGFGLRSVLLDMITMIV